MIAVSLSSIVCRSLAIDTVSLINNSGVLQDAEEMQGSTSRDAAINIKQLLHFCPAQLLMAKQPNAQDCTSTYQKKGQVNTTNFFLHFKLYANMRCPNIHCRCIHIHLHVERALQSACTRLGVTHVIQCVTCICIKQTINKSLIRYVQTF